MAAAGWHQTREPSRRPEPADSSRLKATPVKRYCEPNNSGSSGALRAKHGLNTESNANHHDGPHKGDVAKGYEVEGRE